MVPCHRDSIFKQTSRAKAAINSSKTKRVSTCNYIFFAHHLWMGNPSPCSELSGSFPSSLDFSRSHSPTWACFSACSSRCLSAWNPAFPCFWDAGRERQGGWMTHQGDKRSCMFFTLTSPACPKASNPERGGSLPSQTES